MGWIAIHVRIINATAAGLTRLEAVTLASIFWADNKFKRHESRTTKSVQTPQPVANLDIHPFYTRMVSYKTVRRTCQTV